MGLSSHLFYIPIGERMNEGRSSLIADKEEIVQETFICTVVRIEVREGVVKCLCAWS